MIERSEPDKILLNFYNEHLPRLKEIEVELEENQAQSKETAAALLEIEQAPRIIAKEIEELSLELKKLKQLKARQVESLRQIHLNIEVLKEISAVLTTITHLKDETAKFEKLATITPQTIPTLQASTKRI